MPWRGSGERNLPSVRFRVAGYYKQRVAVSHDPLFESGNSRSCRGSGAGGHWRFR